MISMLPVSDLNCQCGISMLCVGWHTLDALVMLPASSRRIGISKTYDRDQSCVIYRCSNTVERDMPISCAAYGSTPAKLSCTSKSGERRGPTNDALRYRSRGNAPYIFSTGLTRLRRTLVSTTRSGALGGSYPVGWVLAISFMNIRTSVAFGFPSDPLDTVMSSEPSVVRAARDTRSAYCAEIVDALLMIASSSAIALLCWSGKPLRKSSICAILCQHFYCSLLTFQPNTHRLIDPVPGVTGHKVWTQIQCYLFGCSIGNRRTSNKSNGPNLRR